MKKLFLMLAFAGFLTSSYAQTVAVSEVPAVVTKAFSRTHSKIDTVQWSKVGETYKANYQVKMKDMAVTYSATGKLKETEAQISVAALPTLALKYLNENFPGEVVKWASTVTSAAGKVKYAVKVKGMDLSFDSNGKIVK